MLVGQRFSKTYLSLTLRNRLDISHCYYHPVVLGNHFSKGTKLYCQMLMASLTVNRPYDSRVSVSVTFEL